MIKEPNATLFRGDRNCGRHEANKRIKILSLKLADVTLTLPSTIK
jgi:hypothetical protein